MDPNENHRLDTVLQNTLSDDIPFDVEQRMRRQLRALRCRMTESEEQGRPNGLKALLAKSAIWTNTSYAKRLIVSSGLAAFVLLGVSLTLLVISGQQANAAEQLEEVITANRAYKGWVTMTVTDGSRVTRVLHWHFPKRTAAMVSKTKDHYQVSFASIGAQQRFTYDSSIGEIHVTPIDATSRTVDEDPYSEGLTITAFIARMKQEADGSRLNVSKHEDENLDRYVVIVPSGDRVQTIWVDPDDKLIRRFEEQRGNQRVKAFLSYEDPGVDDIYDLGVPRDAKIVDSQHNDELKTLLSHLDQRAQHGFGDGVVIITQRLIGAKGQKFKGGQLHLSLRQGKSHYHGVYRVDATLHYNIDGVRGVSPPYVSLSRPHDWPRPHWDVIREVIGKVAPSSYVVSDGERLWRGRYLHDGRHEGESSVIEDDIRPTAGLNSFVSYRKVLWPTRDDMWLAGAYAGRARVTLLSKDDDRDRKLIGVQVKLSVVGAGIQNHVWWFDRSRGYAPVEKVAQVDSVSPGGQRTESFQTTRFVKFAQLPDGMWYPARWETPNLAQDGQLLSTRICEVTVLRDAKIKQSWFSAPQSRLKPVIDAYRRTQE